MESKTKNRKSRIQIDAMVRRGFHGVGLQDGDGAVRELPDGWFNAVYAVRLADGRDVILKIAPAADAEVMQYERNIMQTEVGALRLVRRNPGIPVPDVLFFDDTNEVCDSSYFFMEMLEGQNLEHVYASLTAERRVAIDREIGAVIRHINGFSGSFFGYEGNPELRADTWKAAFLKIMEAVLADAARKSAVFDYRTDEIREVVGQHVEALDEVTVPCLVHWDAWNPNFFLKDGRIAGIIDFERALWAEPLMEAHFRSLAWEGVTPAMHGYGKTDFTSNELRRSWLYTLHLALVMHVECYFRQYDSDEIHNKSRALIALAMGWLRAG